MKHSSITWSSEPSLSKSPQYRSKSKPTASSLVSYSQIYQEQRRVPRIEDHKSASAMSHGHQSGVQSTSPRGSPSITGKESSTTKSEEWSDVRDPSERRKIQNKLAQRRFRDKVKEQKEETDRESENQRKAGSAYASPEPEDLQNSQNLSGLPWGGISMKHVVERGKSKEQCSQQSSRENSVYGSASRTTGSSSRLGLRLTDQFARGSPAWAYFSYRRMQPPRRWYAHRLDECPAFANPEAPSRTSSKSDPHFIYAAVPYATIANEETTPQGGHESGSFLRRYPLVDRA